MPPQALADAHALVVTVAEIDGVLRREGQEARALVLEEYGLTVEQYLEAKATVRARIAEETAGKGDTVLTYAAAFQRARDAEQFSLDPTYAPRRAAKEGVVEAAAAPPSDGASGPKPRAPSEPGEHWTVQQYAAICAEIAARGALVSARMAAYGLRDDAALQSVHRTWRHKLESHPELREEWARLSAQYRAWLASQK